MGRGIAVTISEKSVNLFANAVDLPFKVIQIDMAWLRIN